VRLLRPGGSWILAVLLLLGGSSGVGQQSDNTTTDPQDIIEFLKNTLDWYHQLAAERQIATEASSLAIVNDDSRVADESVRLAFDFARAKAQSATTHGTPTQAAGSTPSRYQALMQLSTTLDQQAKETQAEIEALRQKLDA